MGSVERAFTWTVMYYGSMESLIIYHDFASGKSFDGVWYGLDLLCREMVGDGGL